MACATLKRNFDWGESLAQLPAKRRRCSPLAAGSSTSPGGCKVENRSAFGEAVSAPAILTPERIAQYLRDDIKRLRRRQQLRMSGAAASSSSGSEGDASPPHRAHASHHQPRHAAQRALFTFKQVRMICEKMLREQEAALRMEYDAALSSKLAEQYEAFIRFNLDQVQRRPPPSTCMPLGMDADHMHQDLVPSYLS